MLNNFNTENWKKGKLKYCQGYKNKKSFSANTFQKKILKM